MGTGPGMGCLGCGTIPILIVALLIILAMFSSYSDSNSTEITASTMERTKLSSSQCTLIDEWYEDEAGWISNSGQLEKGLRYFYDKTGVQPYLYITTNIDGNMYPTDTEMQNKLKEMYAEKFTDEGHIIVCFVEGVENNYGTSCWAGSQAETVMDSEAREILLDYLDHYYTSDMGDEEYFATSFEKAADKVMTVDTTTRQQAMRSALITVIAIAGVIIVVALVRRKKYKAQQAEADAKILNSDLNSYSDPKVDDLEKKYGEDKDT